MELGIIGLGKMGKHMALRWVDNGVRVVAWNRSPKPLEDVKKRGVVPAKTLKKLVSELSGQRIVWLMLPHGLVDDYIAKVAPMLKKNDIIVDGGNSNFKESVRRHGELKKKGIYFVDVGVSGGLAAAKTGYCTMAGGDKQAFAKIMPLLKVLCVEKGYGYMGPPGSGHYVKMVHNAVEYGMMQAIGEGFDLLQNGSYTELDLPTVARVWQHGSIVRSFLMDLAAQALAKDPTLASFAPHVDDSGEGRWSSIDAIENGVPFVANSYAIHARFLSRDQDNVAFKMLSALREGFGGHPVKKVKK